MSQNIVSRTPNKLFLTVDDYNQLFARLRQYPEIKQLLDAYSGLTSRQLFNILFDFESLGDVIDSSRSSGSYRESYLTSHPLFTGTSLKNVDWEHFASLPSSNYVDNYLYGASRNLLSRFIDFALPTVPWLSELKNILDAGWQWYYFSLVNMDHILMQPRDNRLLLNPETFEQAARMDIKDYPQAVKVLCQVPDLSRGMSAHNPATRIFHTGYDSGGSRLPLDQQRPTFGGWSKDQLINAIRKVGTVRFDIKFIRDQGYRVSLNPKGEYVAPSKGQVCGRYSETIFQGNHLNARFPGFGTSDYMPRTYYEALYRAIFHTPRPFKINLIIERRLMDLFLLRFIAIYDFNIPSSIVDTASAEEIGAIITARRVAVFPVASRQEITDIYEPLMKGPGTRFSRAVGQHFKQLGQLAPEEDDFNQYQMEYYRQILDVCTQSTVNISQTRQKILYYIRSLDLEDYVLKQLKLTDLNMVPQDKLCQILQGYVKALISQTQYDIQL